MKTTTNTQISEFTLKNGNTNYRVEYKGRWYQDARTEKKAKELANKAENFNGQHYATHYERKQGFLLCNTRGDQTVTTDLNQVTCPRCLSKLQVQGKVA